MSVCISQLLQAWLPRLSQGWIKKLKYLQSLKKEKKKQTVNEGSPLNRSLHSHFLHSNTGESTPSHIHPLAFPTGRGLTREDVLERRRG